MADFKKEFFTTSSEQERKPEAHLITTSSSTQRSSQQKQPELSNRLEELIKNTNSYKLKQNKSLPSKDKQKLRKIFRKEKLAQFSTPRLKIEKREHSTESLKIITKKQKINEEGKIRQFNINPITFDLDKIEIEQMETQQMKQLIYQLNKNIKKLEEELNSQEEEIFVISQDLINHEDDDEVHMVDRRVKAGVYEQTQVQRIYLKNAKARREKLGKIRFETPINRRKPVEAFIGNSNRNIETRKAISQCKKKMLNCKST